MNCSQSGYCHNCRCTEIENICKLLIQLYEMDTIGSLSSFVTQCVYLRVSRIMIMIIMSGLDADQLVRPSQMATKGL